MPEGMEPEIKNYLRKILNSLTYGLLWATLNALGGLYWGYGIIGERVSIYNIIFFTWFILSLIALIYYYYRTWRN